MIKIVRKGTKQVEQCEVCGCVFSFEAEDLEHENRSNDGYYYTADKITCPQCSTLLILNQKSTRALEEGNA